MPASTLRDRTGATRPSPPCAPSGSEGHSTAEIGRRMNASKNAIVGKAHRLVLPARPSPIRAAPPDRAEPAFHLAPPVPTLPSPRPSAAGGCTKPLAGPSHAVAARAGHRPGGSRRARGRLSRLPLALPSPASGQAGQLAAASGRSATPGTVRRSTSAATSAAWRASRTAPATAAAPTCARATAHAPPPRPEPGQESSHEHRPQARLAACRARAPAHARTPDGGARLHLRVLRPG